MVLATQRKHVPNWHAREVEMFERNRTDVASESSAVPVEVVFADGTIAKGKLMISIGKSVADALNGSASFVEFEPYGGERLFVAKSRLTSVKLVGVPRAPSFQGRLSDPDGFDPLRILGLTASASREERRQAFITLSKTYHPDRYATVELPDEVRKYLDAMARRINAAHEALELPQKKQTVRNEPIFTWPGR
jgi:hypothetical protein